MIDKWQTFVERFVISAIEYPVVLSIEEAGMQEIAVLETSTRTFVGAGHIQHSCEYEGASTFTNRTQRFGRGLRINSAKSHVYGLTLVARHTVEVGLLESMLHRNSLQDVLVGDKGVDGHLGASQRRSEFWATLRG